MIEMDLAGVNARDLSQLVSRLCLTEHNVRAESFH